MAPALHLTDRDLHILAEIGELGLLDTETLHRRHWPDGTTLRACQKRLKLYTDHGLTSTVQLAVWFATKGAGKVSTLHCLTERGGDTVEQQTGERPLRIARSDPKPETFHHRLGVVKARLAIDDACKDAALPRPEWIMEQDLRPDAPEHAPPSEHRMLYHVFRNAKKTFTCQPDAASLLRIPRQDAGRDGTMTELVCFWEIDRSTESVRQATGKAAGYAAAIEQHVHRRYWPSLKKPVVRVFWVCPSTERIDSLSAAFRTAPVAQFFRFATRHDLEPQRLLRDPIWRTVAGERRSILLPTPAAAPLRASPAQA
ncbi:MAG TPA: replication-relaxation family protein [Acidothermaceae bacterium]|nr:replication-relaxation family protein [Acidothermaceae bacterium]